MRKKTLQRVCEISGVGIHTGKKINLSLRPSETGYIEFIRKDLGNTAIKIDPRRIEAKSSTALKDKDQEIQTIEHLLAVLYVFGIDSLSVELDGNEIPILDGSGEPYVRLIQDGGTRDLPEKKKKIAVFKPFCVQFEDASVAVEPAAGFRITYTIEYDHPALRRQDIDLFINKDVFIKEIAPART
jgi:UDP-3-O-[3-hydroxymyristoyl] N-acetylglucosamine deacetylase